MVLSFNFNYSFVDLANMAEENPVSMVIWLAFDVPFAVFIMAMSLMILRKLHIRKAFKQIPYSCSYHSLPLRGSWDLSLR